MIRRATLARILRGVRPTPLAARRVGTPPDGNVRRNDKQLLQ